MIINNLPDEGSVVWYLHERFNATPHMTQFDETRTLIRCRIIGYSENKKIVCVEEVPDKFKTYDIDDLHFFNADMPLCPMCRSEIRLVYDSGYWQGYCVSCGIRGPMSMELIRAYQLWESLCERCVNDRRL